jgi:divalent metal cation (Fe/Co/Zn/Cd) transporter
MKVAVGVSSGILAEAAHSSLDLVAAVPVGLRERFGALAIRTHATDGSVSMELHPEVDERPTVREACAHPQRGRAGLEAPARRRPGRHPRRAAGGVSRR